MFGFIYCMVFIDEKDTGVASVYGIMPVSKFWFMLLRLSIPLILSTLATWLLLLVQPLAEINTLNALVVAFLAGLLAPILALIVASFSSNKMAGMTWFKIINLFVVLPVLAFFFPAWENIFGIIPSHWSFQSLLNVLDGNAIFFPLLIGSVYSFFVIVLLIKYFNKRHFSRE